VNCRILYIVGQLGVGGLERQLSYLLQMLDRDRYRPELVVWRYSDSDVYNSVVRDLGIPLHRFRGRASRTEKLFALAQLVRRLNPEIVHSLSFHTNFPAWLSVQGTSSLAVGAVRSDFNRAVRQNGFLLGWLCARWPRHQIFNSRASANAACQGNRFFVPEYLHVIRNGVDLETFRHVPLCSNGRPLILGVGSLRRVKRWDRLLRVARRLKERGHDFEVQIVGEGPQRGELQEQIRMLGLCDRVCLLGHRSDISNLLARSRLLAHTSDSEGCPNVVIEAMACGRAVVASDSGDISSIVENGTTGFVISQNDEKSFTESVERLLSDFALCLQMSRQSRLKAEREFSLERLTTETLEVYRAIGWKA